MTPTSGGDSSHSANLYAELCRQSASYDTRNLPSAWGGPAGCGVLKSRVEDFVVDEVLGFEADGSGEHLLVQIEKTDLNTLDVARALSRTCNVKPVDVSYAGLKDRQAVTRQWFSIYLPGRTDPDLSQLENAQLRLLRLERHSRKLRKGALRGNRFRLIVRDFEGDLAQADGILQKIAEHGFPNYFGAQRFGRNNSNLLRAAELFSGRRRMRRGQKGLPLSAARSLLFNQVLARRVATHLWDRPLEGEVFQIDGAKGLFREPAIDDELKRRCANGEIHPTGPLWGRADRVQPEDDADATERDTLSAFGDWCSSLEREGVAGDRRSLRGMPADLQWTIESRQVELEFFLPKGSFATSLVREWLESAPDSGSNGPGN